MSSREKNILSLLEDKTNFYSEKIALGIKTQTGWHEYSYSGIGLMSRKLASYLINDIKVKKGECLAILSESKPEYGACVFASILAGMTTVPLDIKLTKYELTSILNDCEPTVILVSQAYINTAIALQQDIKSLKTIILMDEQAPTSYLPSIYSLPDNYDCKWRHRSRKSTALIIYTSGTTGAPKGVEISFGNMLAQLEALKQPIDKILNTKSVNILSILPMNHLFELTVGFATFLNYGFSIYYANSFKPKDISACMKEKKINFMIVVPAFLKLLKSGIENELRSLSVIYQKLFWYFYGLSKYIPFYSVKRFIFKKIHEKFGGQFEGCICGGAPLDISVGEFFERIGIKIYQGYGLSETSPVVCVNTTKRKDLASVGEPLNGFEAKIDKNNGELLLRGASVMKGYHNQPEMTAEVLDNDGWLHTGDIAEIRGGHIYITGRIKNMIVLNGGKKVFPEEVEAILEKSDKFLEICVFGYKRNFGEKDGCEEVAVMIVPNEHLFVGKDDIQIKNIINQEVKILSQKLTQYKRPNFVFVSKSELPKTTTRKVKRNEVKLMVENQVLIK